MPEEKKEKFTFSDKIKNSKPAGNKSFAKSSSKIGRDGKPKATLFERTRRDAPFFIAALVALLLLPFLYKYSGQASEEQLLTPGNEQAEFDPERYGFDTAMIEDPDGQIAQLAGRDSLSLIKGFGGNQEEDYGRDDLDLDASSGYDSSAEGEYAAEKHSSSEMDVEDNTTNIYKRRAGAATRAAFRRTKIGTLNSAGLRRPGGSRLGINNWGGGLKNAAKKVRPNTPASAPKPVSLQPLRAAGSRSTFGQGGAAAARRSKDNMGKANPLEALRDSYVKPVDPTRVGGLDMFSMGPGGGSGKLDRNINITPGKEPWWWDMMKTRMQKEWEKKFERKWKWIDWMDDLARNILGGILNCLITGDDGGDMGSMFGFGGGSGKQATCCGVKAKDWDEQAYGPFGKASCDKLKKRANFDSSIKCTKDEWWDAPASSSGESAGFFGARLNCLGIYGGAGAAAAHIKEGFGGLRCANMPDLYQIDTSDLPRKWQKHTYIYVVARNYFPQQLKDKLGIKAERTFLCTQGEGADPFKIGDTNNSGVALGEVRNLRTEVDSAAYTDIVKQTSAKNSTTQKQERLEDIYEANPESIIHGCVVYVQRGATFNYENFKNAMVQRFKELAKKKNGKLSKEELNKLGHDAWLQLDVMFVESFASKNKLAYAKWFETGNNLHDILPMEYWRFYEAFVRHKKSTNKATGSRVNVDNRKLRKIGEDTATGDRCYFDGNLKIDCGEPEEPRATVVFGPGYKGGQPFTVQAEAKNIEVTAEFIPLNADEKTVTTAQPLDLQTPVLTQDGRGLIYTFSEVIRNGSEKSSWKATDIGNIRWKVFRKGAKDQNGRNEAVDYVTCPYNMSGDGHSEIVDPKPCPNGPQTSQQCCEEIYGAQDPNNNYKWEGGKCVITPKKPEGDKYTILAPGIRCVPNGPTDRQARPAGSMTEQDMCKLFGSPLVGKYNSNGQSCKDLWGFKMDSAKATAFVNRVKEAYNKAHPELPIKFDKTYPQDSEFIDALNIATTVGINDVPMAAVCEMGRDFVRMSKDKHAGSRAIVSGATGTKDEQLLFRNELGAFLAYVHDTSILYPDAFVRVNGKDYCDWRFQPYGVSDGGCSKTLGPKMGKAYAHNNYNGTKFADKYSKYFVPSLTETMKQAPLKALVSGHQDLPHNCGNCKAMNGQNNVKKYNSYQGFAGLLHEESPSTNGQGVACEAFLGGNKEATMSVADALKYIEGLCTAGLDYKPVGQGNKNYVQGQSPTADGGASGGDPIVGKNP